MKVEFCDKNGETKFQDFVTDHPKSLIYHTSHYRDLISNHLNCDLEYFFVTNDGVVEAILTAMSKEGRLGKVFNAMPFFGSTGGILAKNERAYGMMLSHYNRITKDASFATFIENPFEISKQKPDHDLIAHRICQITDTERMELDTLDGIFTSKKRNDLRRALQHKIDIDIDSSDEAKAFVIGTHIENMRAIKAIGKSKEYFQDLFSIFRVGADYDIFTAKKDGVFVAALLLLYHKNIVEYYTPVISKQHRHLQALSLIIYEAMKLNKSMGRPIWNWGANGTSLDSVYKFKKSWGAVDLPYKYFTKTNGEYPLKLDPHELLSDYGGFYLYPFEQRQNAA